MLVPVLWLGIALAVPLWLMATRQGHGLLLWVVLLTFTDIGLVRSVINVPAVTLTGLLLTPYCASIAWQSRHSSAMGWASAHMLWLVFLGLVFGLAFPWVDELGRPFNLRPDGRTILYLLRELASFSVAIFVGQQVARDRRPDALLDALLVVTLLTSAVAIVEYVTGVSYYVLFTEGLVTPTYRNLRVRGLNFEPRGLALIGAHGIVLGLLCLAAQRRVRLALSSLLTTAGALFLSASTSGLLALAAGVGAIFMVHRRVRRHLLKVAVVGVLLLGVMASMQWERIQTFQQLLNERVGTTDRFGIAHGWFQKIVYRMEIFDTSAMLFLADQPVYAFTGTGPGLVPIPASPFMPITPYTIAYVAPGLNSPPTMGWLLELTNGGIVALLLWAGFVLSAWRSLQGMAASPTPGRSSWLVAQWSFLGAAAIYCLAGGFTSTPWTMFVGLGLGASFLRRQAPGQQRSVALSHTPS